MVHGRWKPFAALQGLINPGLNACLATDARTQAALTHLDQPTHAHSQTGATT